MPLDCRPKVIGPATYYVTQLDALKGRKVFARLARLASPVLKQIATSAPGVSSLKVGAADSEAGTRLASGLADLIAKISEDDVDYFCDVFAPMTEVDFGDGKRPKLSSIFALHFAGNYSDMLSWLLFCLEVNFGNFLERVGLPGKEALPAPLASA